MLGYRFSELPNNHPGDICQARSVAFLLFCYKNPVRPALPSRRQPAILLVLAALWSAHNLPADVARQVAAKSLQISRLTSISKSSRAKVLLCRLSTEARNVNQLDLRTFVAQLLALSPGASIAGPQPTEARFSASARKAAASSPPPYSLFERPPPSAFLA